MAEGEILRITGNEIPQSTDIVFIIEAKPCNKDILSGVNLNAITIELNKKLTDVGLKNNR